MVPFPAVFRQSSNNRQSRGQLSPGEGLVAAQLVPTNSQNKIWALDRFQRPLHALVIERVYDNTVIVRAEEDLGNDWTDWKINLILLLRLNMGRCRLFLQVVPFELKSACPFRLGDGNFFGAALG